MAMKYLVFSCLFLVLGPGSIVFGPGTQWDQLPGAWSRYPQDSLETWFAFCTIFAMGSCLSEVDGIDYRKLFSNWWKNEILGDQKFGV